jgi:MFS family permease
LLALLGGSFGAATYFVSTGAFQALFIIAVSYQMGAIAELDTRGRFLVMMTAAQGLGAAVGPALAGALIGPDGGYRGVIGMALLCCFLSTLAFLYIVHRSRKVRSAARTAAFPADGARG